ncbi:MAG: hypothetical protein AVDCRST_MAG54-1486 [uncultured Actinomycetospora sp.]|uniref:Uncharacterized protein n=1 Tax=uncultured Actinomycetospora sp. TaxID=1135996 RepID=A0A6J4I4C0_9PSEU|nr:MAG: hypothetical protein AVDCRST_MAG54-1486 [uncultured Actinomycetospora sp.]
MGGRRVRRVRPGHRVHRVHRDRRRARRGPVVPGQGVRRVGSSPPHLAHRVDGRRRVIDTRPAFGCRPCARRDR